MATTVKRTTRIEMQRPWATLHCALAYECTGGVSPVLENGTARGHTVASVQGIGPLAPTYLFAYADRGIALDERAACLINAHKSPTQTAALRIGAPKGVNELPADSRICLQAFVTSINDSGDHCPEDCGRGTILLSELLTQHAALTNNGASGKNLLIEVPLRIHSTRNNRQTGTVRLLVQKIDVQGAPQQPIRFGSVRSYMNMSQNLSHASRLMDTYLAQFERESHQFHAVIGGVENIDCPIYPSEVTFCDTSIRLPVGAFMLFQVPRVAQRYWYNAFAILADRYRTKTSAEFARYYLNASLAERCGIAGKLVFQYVQQLDYVADRTSAPGRTALRIRADNSSSTGAKSANAMPRPKQAIEMFGDALVARSGDCEDLAAANAQFQIAFCRDFNPPADSRNNTHSAETRALLDMQRLLRQYVGHVVVEGVTAASVGTVPPGQDPGPEVQGAHAALKLLPRDYHNACVARWNPDHMLAKGPTVEQEYAGQLPIIVGEGTGMVDPVAVKDDAPASRELLEVCPAFQAAKKPLKPPPGTSPFYKALIFSVTRDFMDDYRTSAFRFALPLINIRAPTAIAATGSCRQHGGDTDSTMYTKGVRFADFIGKSTQLRLIPFGYTAHPSDVIVQRNVGGSRVQAHVGNLLQDYRSKSEFTGEMMNLMRSTCKTRIPPPSITLEATDAQNLPTLDSETPHPQLETLVRIVQSQAKKAGYVPGPRHHLVHVETYLSVPQAAAPHRAPLLQDFCCRVPGVFVDAEYTLERLDDHLSVYRITFFCDEARATKTLAALKAAAARAT